MSSRPRFANTQPSVHELGVKMRALSTYGSVAPIGVKHKLTFVCEHCNTEFDTIDEASECENKCAAAAKRALQEAELRMRAEAVRRSAAAAAAERRRREKSRAASSCPSSQIKKRKVERSASRADESHLEESDSEEDDDVPKVGDHVEFLWDVDEEGGKTRKQWYAGIVCSVTDKNIVVKYHDDTTFPHPRKTMRERHTWRYEDGPCCRPTDQGINRGSCRRGQKDRGRKRQKGEADSDDDMDQYDRIPGDTIIGRDRVAQYVAEEHEYEDAKRNETSGGTTQGYRKDGFVVSDDVDS